MNDYELMVIFSPLLNEDIYKKKLKKYLSFIKENEGSVVHQASWGLKSLAYPIQKKTTGFYWVVEYQAPPQLNNKLKTQLLRDDGIFRHLITALDKYAVAYNIKKRQPIEAPVAAESSQANP